MEEKLYRQVARALEDDILTGIVHEGEPVPSTHQYAHHFEINPATAARGVASLTAQGILFKKRGVGMFVAEGARERIRERRRADFRERFLEPLLEEARLVGISRNDLMAMMMAHDR